MGILKGALTVRRYKVAGDVPADFRSVYVERLDEHAFHEPPRSQEEAEGWVQVHNLLDNSFQDTGRWLYGDVAVFALRVDKKTLPARLLAAHVAKECERWCAEQGKERCPASVRTEIRDRISDEWLQKVLPRVAITEAAWSISGGWLLLHSHSETVADRFRKRFLRTFGLTLVEFSPLDFVSDPAIGEALLQLPATDLSSEGR
jgi:DNA recombination-dependent growth factor C